ncbi:MAG: peptidylprolyl isomerase [Acidobacteriota bacterium]|nr:peptidylprolyl isomerase [Acidobacteriota bacterium]
MSQANQGDRVRIHYTGTLDDGSVFDSSQGRDPLEFVIGSGQVIPGFDEGVRGMSPGEEKSIHIPSDQAYGPHNPEMVISVPRDQMPAELNPQPGQQLQMQTAQGQPIPVVVVEADDSQVRLDANHPLAGKDLNFALQLVSVN